MIRLIVFDTNVLISALLAPKSSSSTALRRALRDHTVVYSDSTLAELGKKIRLPRFDKYQSLSRRIEFYHDYEMNGYPINITHKIQACRDPKMV